MNFRDQLYYPVIKKAALFAMFAFLLTAPLQAQFIFDDYTTISSEDLNNQYRTIFLPDGWKFSPGDNSDWAAPDFDDWDWMTISTSLNPATLEFIEWQEFGWFRTKLNVDPTLVGIPLALEIITQSGVSEIFLNGKKSFSIGNSNNFMLANFESNNLHVITFPEAGIYTVAIRFWNNDPEKFKKHGLGAGFHYALVEADYYVSNVLEITRLATRSQAFFGGTLIVFGLIHFLLFLYYRKQPENLYFALFTLSFALFIALSHQATFTHLMSSKLLLIQWQEILKGLTIIFFLRFLYELLCTKVPEWRFWSISVIILSYVGYAIFNPTASLHIYLDTILILLAIEAAYMLYRAIKIKQDGAAIFGSGLIVFLLSNILIIMSNFDILVFSRESLGAVGTGALLIAMSVSLSRKFAKTSSRLEQKLIEVQQLSEEALEKERKLKKEELDRKLLEADNKRKTAELDEARRLQLSMLPKSMPDVPDFQIAAHMLPATEVGGDYYDFHRQSDDTVTFAVGDATGHGLKAGIIVATVKSFFHTHAGRCSSLELLKNLSDAVRNMKLHMMYMGMTLVRLKKNRVELAAAGMPPLIYYNSKTGKSELVTIKGMPLGSVKNYPYQTVTLDMHPQDILIVPSDGLPELFNEDRQMYEYPRMQSILEKYHHKSAEELIEIYLKDAEKWTANAAQQDDITLMVFKHL